MSNLKTDSIRIVKGSERFAGSTDNDMSLDIELKGGQKNFVEKDRTTILNLAERFDKERQISNKIRVSGKITNIFENDIVGTSSYEPFLNNLFYVNPEVTVQNGSPFKGYPPADEFTFVRTTVPSNHISYNSESASTYNWRVYLSYPFENDYDQELQFEDEQTNIINQYVVSDGIPFIIKNKKSRGKNLIYFYCAYNHNLQIGDSIELTQPIDGRTIFEVYSLGDNSYGNDKKVFTIYNFGYQQFFENTVGNFKRIIDINNPEETKSEYYCRKHKILTNSKDVDIVKLAYEQNPFFIEKKLQYSALTPNNVERLAVKEDNQTFSLTFNKDIDITGLRDNNKRPLSSLFVTIVKCGYVGWFNNSVPAGNTTSIEVGWDMNFSKDQIDGWWSKLNPYNRDNLPNNHYTLNGRNFYFTKELEIGTEIKGDICEWNEYDQQENVLSSINHKISFNLNNFNDGSDENPNIPNGYSYKPHHEVKVKEFSDSIEFGDKDKVDQFPDYAFFSDYDQQWRWRDLYEYGFIDENGKGVDFPFLNGSHYPFKEITFLQTPMFKNLNLFTDIIIAPNTDGCE